MSSRNIENRTVYHGGIFRFFASSRILTVITWPIIFFLLFMKLEEKNITAFMGVSIGLLILLWLNVIFVSVRTFDPVFTGTTKFTKIVLVVITSVLTYALFYTGYLSYKPNDAFFLPADYMKNTSNWQRFFDMTFLSGNVTATLGYNSDITPKDRVIKFALLTQFLVTILLLIVVVAKF